jgi:hypothetical protein
MLNPDPRLIQVQVMPAKPERLAYPQPVAEQHEDEHLVPFGGAAGLRACDQRLDLAEGEEVARADMGVDRRTLPIAPVGGPLGQLRRTLISLWAHGKTWPERVGNVAHLRSRVSQRSPTQETDRRLAERLDR